MRRERGKNFCKKFTKMALVSVLICVTFLLTSQKAEAKTVNCQSMYLLIGDKKTISLGAHTNSQKYQWSSKNKKIATVNSKGKVTARKKGSTVITAKRGKKEYKIKVYVRNEVDLIIFAGQSNMSGGGNAALAPTVIPGAGYEYRSVTEPKTLKDITEPFGKNENSGNLNDYGYKRGSMVSSFVNAYYKKTKVPVVAVSATRIGSSTYFWKNSLCSETAKRYKKAATYLKKRKIKIRHRYVVWFQGEAEGVYYVDGSTYISNTKDIVQYFQKHCKTEQFLMVRIGRYFGSEYESKTEANLFDEIIRAQTKLALEDSNFVLVSVKAASLPQSYYNEEGIHLNQTALNMIGEEAGENAAYYVKKKKQPTMFDAYLNTWIHGR